VLPFDEPFELVEDGVSNFGFAGIAGFGFAAIGGGGFDVKRVCSALLGGAGGNFFGRAPS